MPAVTVTSLLTFLTLCGSTVVSGVIQPPRNVRISSYNMDLVLSWDPPEGNTSGLIYTTEYNTPVSDYRAGCKNITTLKCDFTSLGSISVYGKYAARVRAELGGEKSIWVESTQITMDKNTVIGPPSVSLTSSGANIEVVIADPVLRISELRRVYNSVTYNITYWKEGHEEKAVSESSQHQIRVVLPKLEPLTRYCVQVHIRTQHSNPSEPSSITCENTDSEEEAPWLAAVVTFVIMATVVTLVVVAVVHRKKMAHFLCPKDSLPQHFKEYLLEPPSSYIYLAMKDSRPPEEIYHQVSVVADGKAVEEERPLEAAGTNCTKQPEVPVGET